MGCENVLWNILFLDWTETVVVVEQAGVAVAALLELNVDGTSCAREWRED
jgi:hypothetical protein